MKQIQFWKRELGALWNPFERERIVEFSGIKSNEQVNLSGYVKWVRTKVFVLVPTLFSNQTYILCLNYTERRPPENAFITISGLSRRYGLRKKNDYSRVFKGDFAVDVHDWKVSKPDFKIPKDETKYEDFKRNLTCRIEGLEPIQKDFLAFTIISTPSIIGQSGGINATLYDSTKSGIPKKVIKEIELAIPKDMEKICTVKTPLGKFGLRYEYNYLIGDADEPLSNINEKFLTHNVPEFKEASLSLFSKSDRPLSIEDPPCSLSDIPTVTPETTQINHDEPYIDQFDAFRYLTTSHFKIPIIQDFDDSISTVVTGLERLNDSWDLPPTQIAKYGFLDANYNARPLSVLRQCLAYARAKNLEIITSEWVNQVFDEYFIWNFEYVNEIWEDLLTRPLVDDKTMMASLRVKYREIIRILRRNYSSKEIGVSKETILNEIEEPLLKVNELINDCKRDGVIYESRSGFYKLTREYD